MKYQIISKFSLIKKQVGIIYYCTFHLDPSKSKLGQQQKFVIYSYILRNEIKILVFHPGLILYFIPFLKL